MQGTAHGVASAAFGASSQENVLKQLQLVPRELVASSLKYFLDSRDEDSDNDDKVNYVLSVTSIIDFFFLDEGYDDKNNLFSFSSFPA